MSVQIYLSVDPRPGPSSQTAAGGLSVPAPAGEGLLVIDRPSFHAGMPRIRPSTKRPWDEAVTKILRERAEAWETLAEL